MAENAHSTPASRRADTRVSILTVLIVPFLIALSVFGLGSPDPVASGHAYAVEAVR
ncbi:hypothetical protein [Acetobacter sp.]|jgi:hypothetical protein|uniref:hypothetical protein n=1 Tax=Acetobacter sp. TaxID=440 RepID=UPI0025B85C16|nr:hypothetical protein [Acetobacter sp.]MCH4091081.1 hypothetical protein [Acetobacter sp.]MCI1300264.1 hypothetical protein [Acetobacter sp.]MCI1316068.1 hypothetical protein [Acetobacter sp.]